MVKVTVQCKECNVDIDFFYDPVCARVPLNEQAQQEEEVFTLTCTNGHTHDYLIEVPGE